MPSIKIKEGGQWVEIVGGSSGGVVGAGITVKDENSPLQTAATTLNFVGAGVTATGTGAEKTITINGGGGGGDVTVTQTGYSCDNPITTSGSTIGIGTTSNAYGTRYVEDHLPLSSDGCDGDLWYYTAGDVSSNIVLETPQSTASGTEVEFTGIPSWAKRITIMFNLVSLDSNGEFQVQLGTSSAYITSGYTATSQSEDGATIEEFLTNAFVIGSSASHENCGKFQIDKFSDAAYVFVGQGRSTNTGSVQAYGVLNGVSGTIDRLRITPTSGNFDGGSINISYE